MALRRCLKCLNPLNQKPGLDYALFLLKPSNALYAIIKVENISYGIAVYTGNSANSLDTSAFENITRGYREFYTKIDDCVTNAITRGVKPNCGIPEIDEAVKAVQGNPRDRTLLERVKCLHVNAYITRILNDASRYYAIIRGINPCGFGSIILLPGSGIYDLPQSKLGIVRLLSQLIPEHIQVEEGWNEYTRLAYLVARAPKELLTHIALIANRLFNIEEYTGDRLIDYIITESLLSSRLGVLALIDFEGDVPFIVKFPRAPFNPDEA